MARGSINKVTLIGAVGRDPESRYMPNGNAVCNLSLATDEGYNDKNSGQRVDRTEWHRIVAFGRLAEIISQYVKKGSKIYVEGRLQTREWEKDGIKRYTTEIVINDMTMLDSRNNQQGHYQNTTSEGSDHMQPSSMQQLSTQSSTPNQSIAAPYMTEGYGQPAAQPFSQQAPQPQNAPQSAPASVPQFADFDDDIPF